MNGLLAKIEEPFVVDDAVLLGYLSGRVSHPAPLKIGPHARIRSGTVLYAGSTIGACLETGHNVVIREENEIGDHFHVWSGAHVGYGCRIGHRVTVHCNVYVAQFTEMGDDVFVAPGCAFADDTYPCSQFGHDYMKGPVLEEGVKLGINVTVLPNVRIGFQSLIGAGSVVTRDVPPLSVAYGNPARVHGNIYDISAAGRRPVPPYPKSP